MIRQMIYKEILLNKNHWLVNISRRGTTFLYKLDLLSNHIYYFLTVGGISEVDKIRMVIRQIICKEIPQEIKLCAC